MHFALHLHESEESHARAWQTPHAEQGARFAADRRRL